jgi:RNA polymerase sigma-70 factor (sigma-E family)
MPPSSYQDSPANGGNFSGEPRLLTAVDDERGARGGRDEVVSVLYFRHRQQLVRLAVGLVGNLDEAEEVVQDAFAGLLRQWQGLRDVDAAPAYLHAAVVNGARARWRRRRLWERARFLLGRQASSAEPDLAERSMLMAAIARLPVRKRACVLLRYYADLSEAETAAALGVSVGTVKSQTAKALVRLSELLAGQQSRATR